MQATPESSTRAVAGKSFTLTGADGKTIPIAAGEYYFNTKARARRMMQNSLSSDARRVYACLELATMGFQQELAVIAISKGSTRPLTPNDVEKMTGLSRQHVRHGLEDLENAGLAMRQAQDGGALRKGQVLLYSWAVPRQLKEENCSPARLQFPEWFPESWEALKPLISRFKYNITVDEETARGYKEELDAAAKGYKEAEKVALRALERVCAERKRAAVSLLMKEQKDIREITSSSSAVSSSNGSAKAEEEDRSLYPKFKALYPAARFDEAKAKPYFEGKTKAEQARILERLEVYLVCERWKDEAGRWIPLASNWLPICDADPPPKLQTRQNGRRTLEEQVKFKEMQDEFDANAVEINDALVNGRPLTPRQQELLDHMVGGKT